MAQPTLLEQIAAGNTEDFDVNKWEAGNGKPQANSDFDVSAWENGKDGKPGPTLLEQIAAHPAPPPMSDEDKASQTRQMAVGALTGMPTPNMTPQDVQQFQAGKAAGAASVPLVAAGAGVVTPEAIPALVATLSAAAKAHPIAAKIIQRGLEGSALEAGWKLTKKVFGE